MKPSTTAAFVLMALAAACTEPSKPLAVPDAAEIESMYVYRLRDSANTWAYETADRRRIAAVLAHLREHNTGYRVATRLSVRLRNSHLPDHDYQVLFLSASSIPLGIYIGPDWLAGRDELVKFAESERRLNLSRQRPLGAAEREALVALVEPQPLGGDLRFFIGPDAEPH